MFGLTNQLRRAAVSVSLNIAEGAGNDSPNEFCRFLTIALRSLNETITALEIAMRLHYCTFQQTQPLIDKADEISAMIVALTKTLKERADAKRVRESTGEYSVKSNI